jgi:hypothetical protein
MLKKNEVDGSEYGLKATKIVGGLGFPSQKAVANAHCLMLLVR